MTIYRHHHCCPNCGHVECEELAILGVPLDGQFRGKCVQIPVDGNVVLIGFGHKLRLRVDADWAKSDRLSHGTIYAYVVGEGVVALPERNLKQLADQLGCAFVRVDQGILLARAACRVPDDRVRMAGVHVGVVGDTEIIAWVRCSKEGAKRLGASVRRRRKRARRAPALAGRDIAVTA
jgi:hypothetical protein